MNEELFDQFEALTFDDLLIVPGYTEVLPDQTDVRARLARDIWLNVPHHLGGDGYRHRSAAGDCVGA